MKKELKDLLIKFKQHHFCSKESSFVSKFELLKPKIVIFAFKKIEKSQVAFLDLTRNSKQQFSFNFRTILLCTSTEINKAYNLCLRNVFDDYVMLWPNYDIDRISYSIYHLSKNIELVENSGYSQAIIKIIKPKIEIGNDYISDSIKEELYLKDKADKIPTDLYHKLKSDLNPKINDFETIINQSKDDLMRTFSETSDSLQKAQLHQHSALATVTDHMNTTPKRILLIEDDVIYREIIKTILEDAEYEVFITENLANTLNMLKKIDFDLLLVDYSLPGITGIEIINEIKKRKFKTDHPMIMLTGNNSKEIVKKAVSCGVFNYIIKPCEKSILLCKIENAINDFGKLEN